MPRSRSEMMGAGARAGARRTKRKHRLRADQGAKNGLGGGRREELVEIRDHVASSAALSLTFSLSVQIWMALGISLAVFSFFRHVTSFSWMEI